MAICVTTFLQGGRYHIIQANPQPSDIKTCAGNVLLSPSEYTDWLAQMTAFGFDQDLFQSSFIAALGVFVVGLGIGLIISHIRKVRP